MALRTGLSGSAAARLAVPVSSIVRLRSSATCSRPGPQARKAPTTTPTASPTTSPQPNPPSSSLLSRIRPTSSCSFPRNPLGLLGGAHQRPNRDSRPEQRGLQPAPRARRPLANVHTQARGPFPGRAQPYVHRGGDVVDVPEARLDLWNQLLYRLVRGHQCLFHHRECPVQPQQNQA